MPKISVITPVYNSQPFIKESLNSIINQTFQDFEFIIINDGSTDATNDLIKMFKDNRIRYISHNVNKGVTIRSKEAIELASSDYIAIHDGDDISMSNRLEQQFKFLENNLDIFCVGGHAKKIAMDGSFMGDWNFPPANHQDIVSMLAIYKKCPIINPTAMFRTKIYKELGGYSPDGKVAFAHDFDFWCRAILAGKKFANIQEYLIKYKVNPNSMTRRNRFSQLADYNKIISNFLKRIKDVKF